VSDDAIEPALFA